MKTPIPNFCEHCGKEIPLADKCYVKTFKNKGYEPITRTTYTGKTITVTKRPVPRIRLSVALCESCVSEVEALITAWKCAAHVKESD